ncbi:MULTISPECIES: translation initiation factor IF-3 [unclassified Ruminobacter]|uniref:translation initiation factor IF-3 n=1 Tax=Ruminobacter TaxID=866 RepID=UPI0004E14AFF|nr:MULTISPECIES: translation initiation factor IF-3 [unclassified Ruminobacter]MBO6008777.1 translation initiation factor IF-3 [Ruminobacter sp.]MBP3748361.1 translation initiation factor IF-3 [Ruminobacter sp.]MBQ3775105.1 translation initiation factor IF-3 [Ruminobacter sp.]
MNNVKKTGKQAANKTRINGEIRYREVRLIGLDGEALGIMSSSEALNKATEAGVDLVEISPNAEPPVCRIMDYGKFLYEKSKAQKEQKKKQKQVQVKEIKFRPATDEGDYQVKLRNLIRFLEDGDKAKVTMRYRGREIAHQDIGLDVMKRIEKELCVDRDLAVVESASKMEGRQAVMVLSPKKR